MGGRRRFALLAERDWLLARIAATPDLTRRALRAELAEHGITVSYDTVALPVHATTHLYNEQDRPRRTAVPIPFLNYIGCTKGLLAVGLSP